MSRQLGSYATELSTASTQVARRLKIIAALFALLCFVSSFTHAATQIMLGEEYKISFDSGKFDTETFNMQITNLEVLKNGKRYWNADAISLDSILLADGRTLIVKNLKIKRFVSLVNNLKAGRIIVRNVTLDKYDHLLAGEIGPLIDHTLDDSYLGIFDFWTPIESGAEYETFVQSIELTPVRRTTMPSGSSYFNRIGTRGVASVKHRRLYNQDKVLTTESIASDELVTELSLQNFEIAFDLENVLIEDGGIMRSELSGYVDIKNHFSTDIEFDAQIPLPVFLEIMNDKDLNTVFTGEFVDDIAQSFLASFLQSDTAFSKASLSIRDYGAFDRLLNLYAKHSGQSVTAATDDIRLKIDQWMRDSISNEGIHLFPAIEEFLDHGGQLRLSAAPSTPVPFLLFASYLLMPESAIEKLNVTIEQLN